MTVIYERMSKFDRGFHRVKIAIGIPLVGVILALSSQGSGAATVGKQRQPLSSMSCNGITAAMTKASLGVSIGQPSITKNGPVTVCKYSADTLLVRFQSGTTAAEFASERKGFDQHGEKTITVHGIGSEAFSSTFSYGKFVTSTIQTIKGSDELLVTANASLAKVEVLAKKLLPLL